MGMDGYGYWDGMGFGMGMGMGMAMGMVMVMGERRARDRHAKRWPVQIPKLAIYPL